MCVCELASILEISQPAVSKHLKKLKNAGIISSEQDGLWTNYFLIELENPCLTNILNNAILLIKNDKQIHDDRNKLATINRTDLCKNQFNQ